MADADTPPSGRIRAALGIFEISRAALDLDVETRVAALERAAEETTGKKTNLERRLKKLESRLTDPSGLVPHSQRWLSYWDRHVYDYVIDPEHRRPAILFPLEALRAVLKHADNPGSLLGSIPGDERSCTP
jgi:hypothetical protein